MERRNVTTWPPSEFGSGLYDDAAERDAHLPATDWRRLPPGSERMAVAVPSGVLAGVTLGDVHDPRVVLVPGATGSKEDFVLMMPLLAAAGYRVESADLAGQYESAGAGPERLDPPRARYDYDLFVGDLVSILVSGSSPVHVVGYSFGGIVAQLALAQRPELFASLTLLSCPPMWGLSLRGIKRIGWLTGFGTDAAGAALMCWGIRRNLTIVPRERVAFSRSRLRVTRRASVSDIIGLLRHVPDVSGVVAASSVPKLVAVGEHDLWPLSLHAGFARTINGQLAVYRGGHSPCESSPHQLTRDVLKLLSQGKG